MALSKKNSKQTKVLSNIKQIVGAGDFRLAAQELSRIADKQSFAGGQRRMLDFLSLKVFNRLQWLVEARPLVDRLEKQTDLDSEQYLEIALFYVLTAKVELAGRYMKRASMLNKRSILLASEQAIIYEQQGNRDKALVIYNKIFFRMLDKKKAGDTELRVLNRLAGLRAFNEEEMSQLEALCKKLVGSEQEVRCLFGLAKAYAKRGEIDKEIVCLKKANALADQINESQPSLQTIEASRLRLKAIRFLFEEPQPSWLQDYATSDRTPVFILGMPRSGTTLLEQILGAHSLVGNSGESRGMGIAFKRCLTGKNRLPEDAGSPLPFMRYKTLNADDSRSIIQYYDHYQSLLSDKRFITDKELSNIDRVGMILKLYPNAKFICIQRHPLDVCTSIMQHDFSQAYFSASSLKIIQEYEAYYERARHWQAIYPQAVSVIQYESLVSKFEGGVKEILNFIGVPWEDNILNFFKRKNSVRTPSLSLVRSGINAKSVGKWEQYLELILPAKQYLDSRSSQL